MNQVIESAETPIVMNIEGIQINLTFAPITDSKLLETVRQMLLTHYAGAAQL